MTWRTGPFQGYPVMGSIEGSQLWWIERHRRAGNGPVRAVSGRHLWGQAKVTASGTILQCEARQTSTAPEWPKSHIRAPVGNFVSRVSTHIFSKGCRIWDERRAFQSKRSLDLGSFRCKLVREELGPAAFPTGLSTASVNFSDTRCRALAQTRRRP